MGARLVHGVSFTPRRRSTAAAYSEVVLRVSDALLERYGYPSSFHRGEAMFPIRPEPPCSKYPERDFGE